MDNYNYPMGADNSSAPWNQREPEEVEVDVLVSTTLSKSCRIPVSEYIAEEWEDIETEDGERYTYGGTDYDFSNTNFEKEYKNHAYTIPELLNELMVYIKEDMQRNKGSEHKIRYLQNLYEGAQGWVEDELEVMEDR